MLYIFHVIVLSKIKKRLYNDTYIKDLKVHTIWNNNSDIFFCVKLLGAVLHIILCQNSNDLVLGDIPSIFLVDDTVLLSNSPRYLQCLLNQVDTYLCIYLETSLQPKLKCFYCLKKTYSVSYSITLFGSEISQSLCCVYAGCLLQANLKTDNLTEWIGKTAR